MSEVGAMEASYFNTYVEELAWSEANMPPARVGNDDQYLKTRMLNNAGTCIPHAAEPTPNSN